MLSVILLKPEAVFLNKRSSLLNQEQILCSYPFSNVLHSTIFTAVSNIQFQALNSLKFKVEGHAIMFTA